MKEKLREWLDKTGYPLELEAHKTLIENGYYCEKSQLYMDIETGLAREVDLSAYYNGDHSGKDFLYEVEILIECKKSEKPLVVLSSDKNPKERYEHMFGNETLSNLHQDNGATYFFLSQLDSELRRKKIGMFSDLIFPGYSIVQGFSKSDAAIFKGVMGLAKACDFNKKQYHELLKLSKENDNLERPWYRMQIPVLLVDSSIYDARIASNGELLLEEANWSSILIRTPWTENGNISDQLLCIQVINKDFFRGFLNEVSRLHRYLVETESVYMKNSL